MAMGITGGRLHCNSRDMMGYRVGDTVAGGECKDGCVQSTCGAEGGYQHFVVGIAWGEYFLVVGRTVDILTHVGHIPTSNVAIEAVRRRSQSQVGGTVPVATVVTRTKAWASKVTDFVLLKPTAWARLTASTARPAV